MKYHNILLRIVFELMNSLLETKPTICAHFVNTFTIDILLKIFEDYHDTDLKVSAIDTISQLCKEATGQQNEIIFLFRKLGGAQKVINQLSINQSEQNIQLNILVCLQNLTTEDQDILVEFKDLNVVDVLLEILNNN